MNKLFTIIVFLSLFQYNDLFYASGKTNMLEIKSPAFENNSLIPKQYTCDGGNISPSLSWSNIPADAKSLALICDDPDAPAGTWVHWIIYNMPPASKGLQEGVLPIQELAHDTKQGTTDFKKIGYGGPCPPKSTHRYFFRLYALNAKLNLEAGATKKQLLIAMEKHILAEAELIGKYKR